MYSTLNARSGMGLNGWLRSYRKNLVPLSLIGFLWVFYACESSTVALKDDIVTQHEFKNLPVIGKIDGTKIFEGGFSGLHYIPGTQYDFYMVSDRGPNVDASELTNSASKVLAFPEYGPRILHVRLENNQLQILSYFTPTVNGRAFSCRNPDLPGMENTESMISVDWSLNYDASEYGVDIEGITVDNEGMIWICEEYRPALIRINPNTKEVVSLYSFESPWEGVTHHLLDSVLRYRRPNRGFEGITTTPEGKIIAVLQSPLHIEGENYSRHCRILELNPENGEQYWYFFPMRADTLNIRVKDWKLGAVAAIDNERLLVLEHASKKGDNMKFVTEIRLDKDKRIAAGSGLVEFENPQSIKPVESILRLDLRALGWDAALEKAEGIAVINDSTIAIINDNDYGVSSKDGDGVIYQTGDASYMWIIKLPEL